MPKKEWIAMLLAGGQGSRLGVLTRHIAKPALAFGGKYRIIDFSLSNCSHSHIDTVGILTQYKPFLLNSYIGIGSAWDLDTSDGGVHILPPFVGEQGGRWYKGTANAIYENIDFINSYEPEFVLILSGDHIYNMNYEKMLDEHKAKGADVTVSAIQVPWEEASRFGIITTDPEGRIIKFSEKPVKPDSNLASMGIYIFKWKLLKEALQKDEARPGSENDFGKNILPMLLEEGKRLFSYDFQGYWKDVGTLESYYEANMELLHEEPGLNLYDREHPVYSTIPILPPQYIGPNAKVSNCLVANGCTILGEISNSVISTGVTIAEGAKVEHSILLPYTTVLEDARVYRAITGEKAVIKPHCILGTESRSDQRKSSIAVLADRAVCGGSRHA